VDTPNQAVYNKLKEIEGVASVGKPTQNVFTEFPSITYFVSQNAVKRDLDNEIIAQDFAVTIDIWHDESVGATDLLVLVEAKMRELGFNLDFSTEVPNPTDDIYHINARFSAPNM